MARDAEPAGDSRQGLLFGASAFTLWGLYPFYFKALADVPALEIVVHRIVWSTLLLALLLQLRGGWDEVARALREPTLRRGLVATTLLVGANWFAYVLAVTGDQVLDTSLGYFLCPLVSVGLGVLVLKERLNPGPGRGFITHAPENAARPLDTIGSAVRGHGPDRPIPGAGSLSQHGLVRGPGGPEPGA